MLVKPPLATATILKITDIIASITEIIQDQPLPFNNPHANTNAATPNAIDTVETPIIIACIRLVAVLLTLPIVWLPKVIFVWLPASCSFITPGITRIMKIPPPTSNAPFAIISIETTVTPIGRDPLLKFPLENIYTGIINGFWTIER